MKIVVIVPVFLLIYLAAILETHPYVRLDLFPHTMSNSILDNLVYAQNRTLDEGYSNTGTGMGPGVTNITTESDLPNTVNGHVPLSKSVKQHQKPMPLLMLGLHSQSQSHKKGLRIALVVPVFTGAAYNNAFYVFYKHYAGVRVGENVTRNLNLLSSLVTNAKIPHFAAIDASAYAIRYLDKHLALLKPKNNVSVLNDINVDAGSIFMDNKNIINRYDILILGHQEYVTQQEYSNLKTFVANGGTLVLLDGNVFYAQVGYDRITHTITLLNGHGWTFNGKSAWKSVGERWGNETSRWVGSNFLCVGCIMTFANNPFGYNHHEEQYLTNPNDTVLLNYNASILSPNPKVVKNATIAHAHMIAAYELNYKRGRVIGLGLYSDDIIDHRNFLVFFDHLLMARQFNQ